MRLVLAPTLLAIACNGPNNNDNPDGTLSHTGTPPPSFDFKSLVPAKNFDAVITEEAIEAHQVANMLVASVGVVVADEKVQDVLNANGTGGYRGSFFCWSRPEFPRWTFNIGYDTCSDYMMDGAVQVSLDPTNKVLLSFSNFTINDRELGGTFAMDTIGAVPEDLYWRTYDTDTNNPGPKNRVPLGVTVDGFPVNMSYDGGANVSFLQQEVAMWGVATIPGDPEIKVIHGGVDEADVTPDEPPGADVLKKSLNWLDCRCPTSGVSAYDMPLQVSAVTLDIDDLEIDPDNVDDVEIEVPVDATIEGQAVLTHTGCGTYDVSYTSDATTIDVDTALFLGRISFACETLTIDDADRCDALTRAVVALDNDLQVEVTQADLNATALAAVEADFDTSWCALY